MLPMGVCIQPVFCSRTYVYIVEANIFGVESLRAFTHKGVDSGKRGIRLHIRGEGGELVVSLSGKFFHDGIESLRRRNHRGCIPTLHRW